MNARAIVCLVGAVLIAGDIGCGNTSPKSRSLTIAIQPALDLFSGAPPTYAPADLSSSGLLIFENADDSDSDGSGDDTDTKVNGDADMRQMTTVIVRKLTSTPAAGDLLHVQKSGGSGNVSVFRKGATPAASNRILASGAATTSNSDAGQLISDAANADVPLLVEGVDQGNVDLCIDWSGTKACVTLHVRTGFAPRVFADTDRNAAVDPVADAAGRETWTAARGAIVFVNNDRDCPGGTDDDKDPGAQSIRCAGDEADISELQIPSASLALVAGWTPVIRFKKPPPPEVDPVRIFRGMASASAELTATTRAVNGVDMREIDLTPVAALPTIRLGVEGREFNKAVDLFLCVMHAATHTDAGCDRVALKTGQLLLQANDEQIGVAIVGGVLLACATTDCPISNTRLTAQMSADIPAGEVGGFATNDQWVQDEVEICGQRAPRGSSQVSVHLPRTEPADCGANPLCTFFHAAFPGPDRADIDTGIAIGVGQISRNYGGNLEVSQFTATSPGGMIHGANMDAPLVTFLSERAPRQAALRVALNVGWLSVGHVDEVMAVVPAPGGGQRIVLADVPLGRELLTGGGGTGVPHVDDYAALFWHCRGAARDRLPSCYGRGTVASATAGAAPTLTSTAFSFTKPAGREWQFLRFYSGAAAGQVVQLGAVDAVNSRRIGIQRVWRLDTPDWIRCAWTSSNGACDRAAANVGRAPADTLGAPAATLPFWPGDRFVRDTWFVTPAAGDRFVVVEDSLDWDTGSVAPDPAPDGSAGFAAAALASAAAPLIRSVPALHTAGELRTAVANPTFWSKQEEITEILYGPPAATSMRAQLQGLPGGPTIIRLPMLYYVNLIGGTLSHGESLLPAAVNLQVFRHSAGTLILVPKPYGPTTGGADPYETLIASRLAPAGATVRFVDDWEVYHILSGEIHCGTNQTKAVSRPWWVP